MKKNSILGYLLLIAIIFSTGALLISSQYINMIKGYAIIVYLVFIILSFSILLIPNNTITIKKILDSKTLRILLILYLCVNIIHNLFCFTVLSTDFFYLQTHVVTIILYFFLFVGLMSLTKRKVFLSLFFFIGMLIFILIMLLLFLFPTPFLNLTFTKSKDFIYYFSPLILFIDCILYKCFFTTNNFTLKKEGIVISLIISLIIMIIFILFDLKSIPESYRNFYFPDLQKYKLSTSSMNVHFDIISLSYSFYFTSFRIIFFIDIIRILTFQKKNSKYNFLIPLVSFVVTLIINLQSLIDQVIIRYLLLIITILAIAILLIGGIILVKRLHKKESK